MRSMYDNYVILWLRYWAGHITIGRNWGFLNGEWTFTKHSLWEEFDHGEENMSCRDRITSFSQ